MPGVGPCLFMAARHGTISPTLRAGVPLWGGRVCGGGGVGGCCVHPPLWGGLPVGASTGMAVKTRWRPLGSWAPSRKNLGFAGGDSAIIWYGMVWYSMVWYGMVWYGMVWYGMVWYGMVWYGMVWYGMVWYGMVWYGMKAEVPGEVDRSGAVGPPTLARMARVSARPSPKFLGQCADVLRAGSCKWLGPVEV